MSVPVLSRDGWQEWMDTTPSVAPARLSRPDSEALSPAARGNYNLERELHHNRFGPIATNVVTDVLAHLDRRFGTNRGRLETPYYSAVLDSAAFTGKTTVSQVFARNFERQERATPPHLEDGTEHIPVVFVTVDADMTVKDLNRAVLRFYGVELPELRRATTSRNDFSHAIAKFADKCGTRLFVFDDIHDLKERYQRHQLVNSHLKWLMQGIRAGFLYCGVDCMRSSILKDSQTSQRLKAYELQTFAHGTRVEKEAWKRILVSVERELVLLDSLPHPLSASAEMRLHLWTRTEGYVGKLIELVREACQLIVGSSTEPESLTMPVIARVP
jgi:hypothetical protein